MSQVVGDGAGTADGVVGSTSNAYVGVRGTCTSGVGHGVGGVAYGNGCGGIFTGASTGVASIGVYGESCGPGGKGGHFKCITNNVASRGLVAECYSNTIGYAVEAIGRIACTSGIGQFGVIPPTVRPVISGNIPTTGCPDQALANIVYNLLVTLNASGAISNTVTRN